MWRVLALFVGLMLAVGTYAAVAGDLPAAPAPEESTSPGASSSSFGFALAAGAVALAAVMFMQKPRRRFR